MTLQRSHKFFSLKRMSWDENHAFMEGLIFDIYDIENDSHLVYDDFKFIKTL